MMSKKTPTTEAVKILHRRYYDKSRARALELETARLNAVIAREIYTLRKKARLTQEQLAQLVVRPDPSSLASRMTTTRGIP